MLSRCADACHFLSDSQVVVTIEDLRAVSPPSSFDKLMRAILATAESKSSP
jgi:hypothetical protein